MYISTEIGSLSKYGTHKEILLLLKNSGFTAYDFSFFHNHIKVLQKKNYLEYAKELKAYADEIGIVCNQAHAPFPSIRVGNETHNSFIYPHIVKAIEFAGELGAKTIVVHPCNDYNAEQNAEFYQRLLPHAKKANIKICLENMWNWKEGAPTACDAACSHHEDFKRHLDLLPSEYFGACLDVGHAQMAGLNTSPEIMIKTLGNRLIALHVHDNDYLHDNHVIPFTFTQDYQKVIEALVEVGYEGDITFEAENYFLQMPKELMPLGARYMAEVGKYFVTEIENKKARDNI